MLVNIGCDCLTSIKVSPDHPLLDLIDGVLFDKTTGRLVLLSLRQGGRYICDPRGDDGRRGVRVFLLPEPHADHNVECKSELTHGPVLRFFSDADKPAVETSLRKQFMVIALLNDPAVADNKDLIRVLNGGQSVGDHDDGFAGRQLRDRALYQMLIFRIDADRCLIQNDDRRILEQCPCNGYPLFFTA